MRVFKIYRALGFKVDWAHTDEFDRVWMAGLERDGIELFIQEISEPARFGVRLFIELNPTNKLSDLYNELKSNGARVVEPPTMQSWGWTS